MSCTVVAVSKVIKQLKHVSKLLYSLSALEKLPVEMSGISLHLVFVFLCCLTASSAETKT